MKLALFLTGDGNYHMAGWRRPGADTDGGYNIRRWMEHAQMIERAKLDMLFINGSRFTSRRLRARGSMLSKGSLQP